MTTAINIITTILLIPWGGMIIMSPMMIAAEGFRDSKSSIITAMLIISYPVFIFVALHMLGFQYFGMNVNGWLMGAAMLSGGVIVIYRLPGMLLNLQRRIPNSGYFVAKSAVYRDGKRIKGADPATFAEIKSDTRYARDHNHVFYYGKIMERADPQTFTPVDLPSDDCDPQISSRDSPVYWKDSSNVYYGDKIIEQADKDSFNHFAGVYAKDDSYVYYQNKRLDGAKPGNFRFIKHNSIATDGTDLYIYHRRSEAAVDLESFAVVEDDNDTFCKDKNNVYLLFYHQEDPLVKLEGADLATFRILERKYAVDKHNVWFYGYYEMNRQKLIRLVGANPENFTVGYDEPTNSEATDGEKYFLFGKEVNYSSSR